MIQEIRKLSKSWNLRLLENDFKVEGDNESDVNRNHSKRDTEDDTDDVDSSLFLKLTRCSKDSEYFKSEVFKQHVVNKTSKIAELLKKGSKQNQLEVEE